jgi:hypothetical protein
VTRARAAALLALVLLALGCGDDSSSSDSSSTSAEKHPVPSSVRTIESASEDIIDLALAGKRAEAVARAKELESAASDQSAELKSRAQRVAKLAPNASLLKVALASNQVFALVPALFAKYETPVPADVTELDYLDFEAKLESRAKDAAKLNAAVAQLQDKWAALRGDVPDEAVVARYDAHVQAMESLAGNANPEKTQREAQHGLDLVDELEGAFTEAKASGEGSEEGEEG